MRSRISQSESTPQKDPSNLDLLSSIASEDIERSGARDENQGDGSKNRRHIHLELGPLVISGAAIDRLRARIISFTSKLTMDTLRPLPLFLGLSGPSLCIAADAFSSPIAFHKESNKSSSEKIRSRVSRNLAFFATNYAFLAVGTVLVVALMHPVMLLYVGVTWGLWWLHIIVIREDVRLVFLEKDLNDIFTPKRRSWILAVLTVWVAIWKCLRPLLIGTMISAVLTIVHAMMRDPKRLVSSGSASSASAARGSADSDDDSSGSEVLVERSDNV